MDPAGEELLDGPRTRRLPQRWWWVLLALVAAVGVVVAVRARGGDPARPAAAPTPSTSSTRAGIVPSNVTVTRLGRALVPRAKGWVLYGRGTGVVVRIDLATGEIVRTNLPPLASTGPVSFLVSGRAVVVRPLDVVPGYVIADDRPAELMPARLARSGPMFPGPRPGSVWVPTGTGDRTMALVSLDGRRLGPRLTVPPGSTVAEAAADGSGGLLLPTTGGLFDARAQGWHRISTGVLAAVGRNGWLVNECGRGRACASVLLDRATGRRRVIGSGPPVGVPFGVISPDGATAATFAIHAVGVRLQFVDLRTGARTPGHVRLDPSVREGTVAWSPDSRWLFALTPQGQVRVVDVATGISRALDPGLPPLLQLTVTG